MNCFAAGANGFSVAAGRIPQKKLRLVDYSLKKQRLG
jgi:hypothetical protein